MIHKISKNIESKFYKLQNNNEIYLQQKCF